MKSYKFLKSFPVFVFIVSFAISISSCSKKGCTDPDAVNYNSEAEKDDGTCTYEGRVVFWFDLTTSDGLVNYGSNTLTYTVDGVIVGTEDVNFYWTGAPECGQSGTVTVAKDLGSDYTKSFTYSVVDESGVEHWGGDLEFTGNTCWGHELVW